MSTKTTEQIALVVAGIALVCYYLKNGSGVAGIAITGAPAQSNNGLPWFLSYNVPSGFTGNNTPIEPLPAGTTGTTQPAPCVTCSLFPFGNSLNT